MKNLKRRLIAFIAILAAMIGVGASTAYAATAETTVSANYQVYNTPNGTSVGLQLILVTTNTALGPQTCTVSLSNSSGFNWSATTSLTSDKWTQLMVPNVPDGSYTLTVTCDNPTVPVFTMNVTVGSLPPPVVNPCPVGLNAYRNVRSQALLCLPKTSQAPAHNKNLVRVSLG